MKRRTAGVAALVAAVGAAGAAACSDINNHLLEGQQYIAAEKCLTTPAVVDDLPGSDPGDNCAPECVVVPAANGNPQTVFITTTCPPYPGYSHPGYSPELAGAARDAADPCVGAFAVYADGAVCTSLDGGAAEAASDGGGDAARGDAAADGDAGAQEAASDGATGG
jgi:hypothetical protein